MCIRDSLQHPAVDDDEDADGNGPRSDVYEQALEPVSYTHLDVYKRQAQPISCAAVAEVAFGRFGRRVGFGRGRCV